MNLPAALVLAAALAVPVLPARAAPPDAASAASADAARAESRRVLAALAAADPPVADVQRAAAEHDGVDPERLKAWVARPRSAHWLPRVSVEGSRTERDTRVIGVTGTVESDYLRLSPSMQYGIRLTWDLDQLVFSRDEPAAAWTASRLIDRREERVRRATRLYFQRRRLLAGLAIEPPVDAGQRAARESQVDEITAELDELTGGLFSGRRKP
ncbi:MAG TPA: hypothetical protein VFM45_06510 [Anaeromyxobacteraceae bacterium]|nr:hypothetical protein [Anaeromyxobacteraceae bacterium]